ncbi:hypothetical protein HanXRQr2_Chr06g0270541 [Helianthus annuus]|uniref:Uncharacterized protein n=1 Tax=Helianthus annuus TaxID=4232 RepID=A0A9K3IV89_HELAN|nr:hypothetical protein HanXRQr2_Chr06g0270541 [Helianthus annuus]
MEKPGRPLCLTSTRHTLSVCLVWFIFVLIIQLSQLPLFSPSCFYFDQMKL